MIYRLAGKGVGGEGGVDGIFKIISLPRRRERCGGDMGKMISSEMRSSFGVAIDIDQHQVATYSHI